MNEDHIEVILGSVINVSYDFEDLMKETDTITTVTMKATQLIDWVDFTSEIFPDPALIDANRVDVHTHTENLNNKIPIDYRCDMTVVTDEGLTLIKRFNLTTII